MRCLALGHPLLDAHLLRQCQTAAATRSLQEQGGFSLSSTIPWQGPTQARYLQELPLYNYLVIALDLIVRSLDLSGKLASILLWVAAFVTLQFIWKRVLSPQPAFYANLLFIFSPLGIFFGQAFMPEMLILFLSFAFLLSVLRLGEHENWARWVLCTAFGLLGLLVKLPEFAHLYLLLVFVLLRKHGWRGLITPPFIISMAVTLMCLLWWRSYLDSVNASSLHQWDTSGNLRTFLGGWRERFQARPWLMILFYLGSLLAPGPALLLAAGGGYVLWKRRGNAFLVCWLGAILVFYVTWFGNTAAHQSYYNLPALAALSALFGLATANLSARFSPAATPSWHAYLVGAVLAAFACLPLQYLFRQDLQIYRAANWVRDNIAPDTPILFWPNHRSDMVDYPFNATLSYYSRRPTFVCTTVDMPGYRTIALGSAVYAVTTSPVADRGTVANWLSHFRQDRRQPRTSEWLSQSGYVHQKDGDGFSVWKRSALAPQ